MPIRDATSATYTPHADDLGYCLRAVAMYNDGFHQQGVDGFTPLSTTGIYPDIVIVDTDLTRPNRFDKTENIALTPVQYPSVNLPPKFASASTKRFVPENVAVGNDVGEPVTADDPNGAHTLAGILAERRRPGLVQDQLGDGSVDDRDEVQPRERSR